MLINCPIMEGKFTDTAMLSLILDDFLKGAAFDYIFARYDDCGNIVIHGGKECVQMQDSIVEDD